MSARLRLLLIADSSTPEALGSKFLRCLKSGYMLEPGDVQVCYTSPSIRYSPSMSHLSGKVFYRLADKRSWEWWDFQERLFCMVRERRPKTVLVTGILPLKRKVFDAIHEYGGNILNYMTDDPWNPIHYRRCFIEGLGYYDHIFSTKEGLRKRLERETTRSTSWLPFAYDPEIHYEPRDTKEDGADIVFVGTGAKERLVWLNTLTDIPDITRSVYGNNWKRIATPGWVRNEAVVEGEYCRTLASAKVVLGLVRKANGDLSTDRSYEIGAIGACGLYQDTSEHRDLLKDYPEVGFFKTTDDLRQNVRELLKRPELRKELRQIGKRSVARQENTYAARLETIMNWERPKSAK